ncbi:BTAD domain-containing putative transcriptional regulator [Streptomyces sp. NPDC090022]|uniref:AfsR/SARP family transcriptional regulator n=1 Tax=Streptomyces sp. NPDC090022 TaxID=3365920 RepID=UPI0038087CF6
MDFKLLGPVAAERDGRPVALDGSKQRTALAALLLADGQVLTDERLTTLLWGWDPPATSTSQLYTYVSRLRTRLGPGHGLHRHGAGYRMDTSAATVDWHAFQRLTADGRAALRAGHHADAERHFAQALALWHGPALTDVTEHLAAAEGPRLAEAHLAATEDHTEAALALGRHAELVPALTRQVGRHPVRERLRAQLMTALFRCGRRADALATYEDARRTLADDLGIDPGPDLRTLHHHLLMDTLPPPPAAPPTPGSGFPAATARVAGPPAAAALPTGAATAPGAGSALPAAADPAAAALPIGAAAAPGAGCAFPAGAGPVVGAPTADGLPAGAAAAPGAGSALGAAVGATLPTVKAALLAATGAVAGAPAADGVPTGVAAAPGAGCAFPAAVGAVAAPVADGVPVGAAAAPGAEAGLLAAVGAVAAPVADGLHAGAAAAPGAGSALLAAVGAVAAPAADGLHAGVAAARGAGSALPAGAGATLPAVEAAATAPGAAVPVPHARGAGAGPAADGPAAVPAAAAPFPAAVPRGAAGPTPASLPAAPRDFTGRRPQTRDVLDALAAHQDVAITGAPGTGKSALALWAAEHARADFPDGQLYADLRTPDGAPRTPGDVLGGLLQALGTPPHRIPAGPAERTALYRTLLAGRRMLIVLDNATDDAQVRPLLPGGGRARTVITGVRPALAALEGTRLIRLGPLTPAEATGLLARIAGTPRLAADPESVARIAEYCDRLPLALRIAAARLADRPDRPPARLADRLAAEDRRLAELRIGSLDITAALRPALDALDSPAAAALAALATTGLPVLTPVDAAALLDLPLPEAEDTLDRLADARLLEPLATADAFPRYRLLPLVRLLAATRVLTA